jgi:hypothetical protein
MPRPRYRARRRSSQTHYPQLLALLSWSQDTSDIGEGCAGSPLCPTASRDASSRYPKSAVFITGTRDAPRSFALRFCCLCHPTSPDPLYISGHPHSMLRPSPAREPRISRYGAYRTVVVARKEPVGRTCPSTLPSELIGRGFGEAQESVARSIRHRQVSGACEMASPGSLQNGNWLQRTCTNVGLVGHTGNVT